MIKELPFKGKNYKISYLETHPIHPTWYSFEDEIDIRNNFWNIKEGDSVLDIGACCGSYTLTALSQGAKFVWSWAPGRVDVNSEVDLLNENIKINGWENKCKVFGSGLYDINGFLDVDNQQLFINQTKDTQIRVERLDEWAAKELSNDDRIDWIKIDVEGAEVNIINSGLNLIRRFRPSILVENHLFRRLSIENEIRNILLNEIGGYREVATVPYPVHNVSHTLYVPV
jgi:FkbM family methyltransferase